MKQSLKRWWNIFYIVGTVALVVIVGALSDELPKAWQALQTMDYRWLATACGCFVGFYLFKAIALLYYVRRQGVPIRFWTALNSAILGQYYNGITPAASGGQPMQVYHLKKRGVPVSVGTSAVGVKFICYQLVLIVSSLVLFFVNPGLAWSHIGQSRWLVVIGLTANIVGAILVIMLMINEGIVRTILNWGIRIGAKLHLVKEPEKTREKLTHGMAEFHERIDLLRKQPIDMVVMLLWTVCYLFCYMSIIYCVYRALGYHALRLDEILMIQLLLHITVSFMPTPGASGAQEGGFFLFFRGVFPEGNLFAALMVWRFFTYYLTLIVGACITVGNSVASVRREKRNPRQ